MNGVRFDAYTATTRAANASALLGMLYRHGDRLQQGRGFHTFGHRTAVVDDAGDQVGAVQWGGSQGDRVMLEVKGLRSPEVVQQLRSEVEEHHCTRADACLDVDRPGAFDALLAACLVVKEEHRLYGERRGDWDYYPEKGRTQYLGAKTSTVQARLYEKGKQPEYSHLERFDWTRLEIQVRPKKEAKEAFAKLSALEVWGSSKWTRQLAALVLSENLDAHPPGTVRKQSSRDKAVAWMVKQYGPHLVSLAGDLGSWDMLGRTLGEMVREEEERRQRRVNRHS